MASPKKALKNMVRRAKKEAKPFIASALQTGADRVGQQLLSAAREVHQPSDFVFQRFANAVRSGVREAGEEIMKAGMARIKAATSESSAAVSRFPEALSAEKLFTKSSESVS